MVRIFNTYGPRMNEADGRVVSNFIVQALRNEPITIYGDGQQTRSFCYVSDLIDGFVRLMERETPLDVVNIGNPGEFTIAELAREVLDQTGSASELVREPLPQDDPQRRRPDITRARAELGFEPRVPLREGLRATIEHFRKRLGLA
jgi:nucleoside-diphosphate-sugar epimerase